MKTIKSVFFNFALVMSILLVVWCFNYAKEFRQATQIGSEVFSLALPLTLVEYKLNTAEQKINRLKKRNEVLQKCM